MILKPEKVERGSFRLDRNRPVYFIHIPKTAGTMLRTLLAIHFHHEETFAGYYSVDKNTTPASFDRLKFLVLHSGVEMAKRFPVRPILLTFLRDPLERSLSAFYYLRTLPDGTFNDASLDRLIQRARQLELADFLREEPAGAQRHLGNLQTWLLTEQQTRGFDPFFLEADHLEEAKRNLDRCELLGLTERMDDSLSLLTARMGWPAFEQTPRANGTDRRPGVEQLDPSTRAALQELTAVDRELYEYGRDLFERRWQAALCPMETSPEPELPLNHPAMRFEYTFDQPVTGRGWHCREQVNQTWCGWSGPGLTSWLDFALVPGFDYQLRIRIVHAITHDALESLKITVNEQVIHCRRQGSEAGVLFEGLISKELLENTNGRVKLTFGVNSTHRPCDVDPANADSRRLGIAVGPVEFSAR